jgi:outer membrane lipoprotein-sorting protein
MSVASRTGSRRLLRIAIAAIALLALAFFLFGCSGGSSRNPLSADKVLAGALNAFSNPQAAGLHSYSGVATISGVGNRDAGAPAGETRESTMSVAFQAPGRFRWDLETQSPAIESGERVQFAADGTQAWMYQSRSNTYSGLPVGDLRYYQSLLNPGIFAGGSLVSLLELLRTNPSINVKLVAEDTLLGRDAYVIEVSPIYKGSQSGSDSTPQETASGTMRLWIDKEFLFTLQLETPAGPDQSDGTLHLQYTSIEFNGEVAADKFQFSPPPGATEVVPNESTHSGQTIVPGGLPAGFLTPSYRPDGYIGGATGSSSDANGEPIAAYTRLTRGDAYLLIRERIRKDGLPAALMQGDGVEANGHRAWLEHTANQTSLAWQAGDIVVQLVVNQLPDNELLRIADSMPPIP